MTTGHNRRSSLVLTRVLACIAVVASVCSGQNANRISVRLIDGTSGKPMAGVEILVDVVPGGNKNQNQLRGVTDAQGTVRFNLSHPIPDQIDLVFRRDVAICTSWTYTTDRILKTGVIADKKCMGKSVEYDGHPTPGELVVFARWVSMGERFWRSFWTEI